MPDIILRPFMHRIPTKPQSYNSIALRKASIFNIIFMDKHYSWHNYADFIDIRKVICKMSHMWLSSRGRLKQQKTLNMRDHCLIQ